MEKKMSVIEHLSELRYRIIGSIITVLIGAVIIFIKMGAVVTWLSTPLGGKQLYFIGPVDGFITIIEIALVGGIIVGWPVLLYQMLAFILPGCTDRERKIIFCSIPPGILLFATGALFGNQVIFPRVLQFFMSVGEDYLNPMLIGGKYFSFLLLLVLAMGVAFEIPLVMIILARLGFVKSDKLKACRLYGYVVILLVMGFVVPTPDLLTLLSICSPVILLYELSIWVVYFMDIFQRKMERVQRKKEKYRSTMEGLL